MSKEQYRDMQYNYYNQEAKKWSLENNESRDRVVGWFDDHNNWGDYEHLFESIENHGEKIVLDFGCGPGRNLVKYANKFKRIDGVDLSEENVERARNYLESQNLTPGNLYVCNGIDLSGIKDDSYDIVMSTICLQHICVHEIRYNYFKEFLRVLKSGGSIAIQMGFGQNRIATLSYGYYENKYDAPGTNGMCDVRVESVDFLRKDLEEIGFKNFRYCIGPTGPGDRHQAWIYFNADKQ